MTDEAPDTSNNSNPITLPDDHPLVKTLAAQKDQVAKLKAAITPAEQLTALQDKAKRFDEHDARAEQLKVRDEVARAKGLTASLLRGSSKEDFEAHADELIAAGLKPGRRLRRVVGLFFCRRDDDAAAVWNIVRLLRHVA